MNLILRYVAVLLILQACTITQVYEGKDIHKSHNKTQKQVDKIIKTFKQAEELKNTINQLASTPEIKSFSNEMNQAIKVCLAQKEKLISLKQNRDKAFKNLKVNKKKKYKKGSQKYNEVKKFFGDQSIYRNNVNETISKANTECQKTKGIANKYGVRLVDSKQMIAKFEAHKKSLKNSIKKIRKSNKKFEKELNKRGHKHKDEIKKNLSTLTSLLKEIEKQVDVVGSEVHKLEAKYGKGQKLLVVKGTDAYAATEVLEQITAAYSAKLKEYEQVAKKLEKLVKD